MKQILSNLKQRLRSFGIAQQPDGSQQRAGQAGRDATASRSADELAPKKRSELEGGKPSPSQMPEPKNATLADQVQRPPSNVRTRKAVLSKPRQNPLHASATPIWGSVGGSPGDGTGADPLGLGQRTDEGTGLGGATLSGSVLPAPAPPPEARRAHASSTGLFGAPPSALFGAAPAEEPQVPGRSSWLDPGPAFGATRPDDDSGRGPF